MISMWLQKHPRSLLAQPPEYGRPLHMPPPRRPIAGGDVMYTLLEV